MSLHKPREGKMAKSPLCPPKRSPTQNTGAGGVTTRFVPITIRILGGSQGAGAGRPLSHGPSPSQGGYFRCPPQRELFSPFPSPAQDFLPASRPACLFPFPLPNPGFLCSPDGNFPSRLRIRCDAVNSSIALLKNSRPAEKTACL